MKLLDMLAKLGILRFGAKAAVYKSGAERPAEFTMDGVYNADRDLVKPPAPGKDEKAKAARG
jgi:hypothetical protein